MRLRSPAENYIKALIVDPSNTPTADIKERLFDEGLDHISDQYIDKLRAKLKPPSPFHPQDESHKESFKFILEERIHRHFQPDMPMRIARQVLDTPRAKEFIEAMVLVNVPLPIIANFVSRHRGVYCTAEALELYIHYFWNINLLDSTQMRLLIQLRFERADEVAPDVFKDRKKLATSAYYRDARKVAADMPYSPTSALIVQSQLGLTPSRYELAVKLLEAQRMTWLRAMESLAYNSKDGSEKFLNYTNGGRIIEELLTMVMKPEDQMRDQLKAITLKTEAKPIPSIHQLSGGQHTTEVAPMQEAHNDEPAQ